MKFYNREDELRDIKNIIKRDGADLVYISGRRRIGKTTLVLKGVENTKYLYFFVGEKAEGDLLDDFNKALQQYFNVGYIKFQSFKDFLEFIFKQAEKQKLIVIFDEFQNFYNSDKGIFSDLQYHWDIHKNKSQIKIFCLGSHFSLMKKIFENSKAPLRGRKTASFIIKNFSISTQREILKDCKILSNINLLYTYTIFYGIPKYLEIFLREMGKNKDLLTEILDIYIKENGFFLNEGKEIFALEFGKSFDTYFSILTAIALGKTKKSEIAEFIGKSNDSLGIYLSKLEQYYDLIVREIPITEKPKSKNSRYQIKDIFLKFRFRYIFKHRNLIEINDLEALKKYIKKDISVFLGKSFELLTKDILVQKNVEGKLPFRFEYIGGYRDKGGQNEIDIVAYSKIEKKVLFVECKLQKHKITHKTKEELIKKADTIEMFKKYKKYYECWSIEDM